MRHVVHLISRETALHGWGAHGVSMAKSLSGMELALDEVHSFVLRVSVNRAHGRHGTLRPQFQLEHVNSRTIRRSNSLKEACVLLERQVNRILDELGLGGVANAPK